MREKTAPVRAANTAAPVSAALSIVTATLIFAITDNFVGLLAERMSVWQFHVMRAAMMMPLVALVMALAGQAGTLRTVRPGAVLLRAAFMVAALLVYYAAIPAISVSLAAAGLFTSPVWVTVFSVVIFGERVGPGRLAALVLGFAGVCLVLRVGAEPLQAMAVAPMLAGALYALGVIWTRRYCRDESAGALAFWSLAVFLAAGLAGMALTPAIAGAVGHIEGTAFATMPPRLPSAEDVAFVFLLGGAGAVGLVLIVRGYRSAEPTFAALFDFSFLFWVPLFSWLLWGERLLPSAALGMALIVLAGLLAVGAAGRRAAAGATPATPATAAVPPTPTAAGPRSRP
jgi:drug/metabolite transporter (DMT)-like permease